MFRSVTIITHFSRSTMIYVGRLIVVVNIEFFIKLFSSVVISMAYSHVSIHFVFKIHIHILCDSFSIIMGGGLGRTLQEFMTVSDIICMLNITVFVV